MKKRSVVLYALVLVGAIALTIGITTLFLNINQRQEEAAEYPLRVVDMAEDELDPAVWGQNFPRQYDRFMMTQIDGNRTPFGGSEVYSKLEEHPAMVRLWAGYSFAVDHNEERGHYYSAVDQANTQRVQIVNQPAACLNCHAAEAPQMIAEMGWEEFNHTPFNDLVGDVHFGSTCADCHDPETMALRITRPALVEGLAARGVDVTQATRQEMRTYVCAQCHVEYYFLGDNKVLTFPWSQGYSIDNIEAHYDEYGFRDWVHAESGAEMIKIQHPEYEMSTTGIHARSGVTCADCHMPFMRDGGLKISDHWIRSPLDNLNNACQTCHNIPEEELAERVLTIQTTTAGLLRDTETAIVAAIDAIAAAMEAGATDEQLAEARQFHRSASLRWDFVSSENSTGFHSPQEAARVLANAIDFARQAQLSAVEVANLLQGATVSDAAAEPVAGGA
jgi:nitrite reductase (cytochrome c-552)